jgi:hypothetical protein
VDLGEDAHGYCFAAAMSSKTNFARTTGLHAARSNDWDREPSPKMMCGAICAFVGPKIGKVGSNEAESRRESSLSAGR